jgi:microcystin-dependent protein
MALPFSNLQPSLVVSQRITLNGLFPSYGDDPYAGWGVPMGAIRTFAGSDYMLGDAPQAAGQLLSIGQFSPLYSLLGVTYGGNGSSTFALPNLQGQTIIGAGQAPGQPLSQTHILGTNAGSAAVTLTTANLPADKGGQALAFDNENPSLTLRYMISTGGAFPGSGVGPDMMGAVIPYTTARSTPPDGFMYAEGQVLRIADYEALYTVIGSTYGGDGVSTFALPDLRGRSVIGAGSGHQLGMVAGSEQVSISGANLPAAMGGSSAPLENRGPSLALNYIMASSGVYPSTDAGFFETDAVIGEIIAFAGSASKIPNGWVLLDGRTMGIQQHQALFAVLGVTYGGNGQTSFSLPNADGRVLVGQSADYQRGSVFGADTITLTEATTPALAPTTDMNGVEAGLSAVHVHTEGSVASALAPAATLADPDSGHLSRLVVGIASATAADQLSLGHQGQSTGQVGVSGADVTYGGVIIGSFTGGANGADLDIAFNTSASAAAVQAVMRQVLYTTTSTNPPTDARAVSFKVIDPTGLSSTGQVSLTITAVNSAPAIGGLSAATATEQTQATPLSGLTLADDSASLAFAKVKLDGATAADSLGFANDGVTMGNIAGSYDAATGELALTSAGATATVAQWQAALRAVTFVNSSDNPGAAARGLSVSVNDGAITGGTGTSITVTPVDDVAGIGGGGPPLSVDEQVSLTLLPGATVADVDGGPAPSAVTLTITGGYQAGDALAFTNADAAAFGNIAGSQAGNLMTLSSSGSTATIDQWQAALRAVSFIHTGDAPSATARVVTVAATTNGVAGAATSQTVTIAPVNDAPVIAAGLGGAAGTKEGQSLQVSPNLTISDPDSAQIASATVAITGGFHAGDVLGFPAWMGVPGSYDSQTGVLPLTGPFTVAAYQDVLRLVTYTPTSADPGSDDRTLTFTVSDGSATSAPVTRTVSVTPVDTPPSVSFTPGSLTAYEQTELALFGDLVLTDGDSPTLSTVSVRIDNGTDNGQDKLLFADQNGISATFQSPTNLSLGGAATLAQWQEAIRSIRYINTSDTPSGATRTVYVSAYDPTIQKVDFTRTFAPAAVNDAPSVAGLGGTTAATERVATAIAPGLTLADPDSAQLTSATVAITGGFTAAQDELAFTNQNGVTGAYNAQTGVLTLVGGASVAVYEAALRTVTYRNGVAAPDTAPRTISFSAHDGSTAGQTSTQTVTVIPVNDAPTVAGVTKAAAAEQVAAAVAPGLTVTDPDSLQLASATVAITGGFKAGQDVLAYAGGGAGIASSYDAGAGVLTLTGASSLADYQAALRSVTYTNSADAPDTTDRTLSFTVNDGALDSAAVTGAVTVSAVNDAPSLSVVASKNAYAGGQAAVAADLTLSDPDSAQLASAKVTVTAGLETTDVLTAAVTGTAITAAYANGTLTLTGADTLAHYDQVLKSVAFSSTAGDPFAAAPQRVLEWRVGDGELESAPVVTELALSRPPAGGGGPPPPPATTPAAVADLVKSAAALDLSSPKATQPTVTLADGSQVPNPAYEDAKAIETLMQKVANGEVAKAAAAQELASITADTTGIALQAYSFFTGKTPTAEGMAYLINSEANPNDLTDPYYARFDETNRFINMAVNLGIDGEGRAQFEADYGDLSFEATVRKAYDAIIGNAKAAAAGYDVDAAIKYTVDQLGYFTAFGGGPLGAKAAAVGYIMSVGMSFEVGRYYEATVGFLAAGLDGGASYNVDLVGAYGTPGVGSLVGLS